ncbi:MAG: hypothetical protein ACI9FR_000176 [Cryomorphaceae bacterium]|jgi:hypothetical protein
MSILVFPALFGLFVNLIVLVAVLRGPSRTSIFCPMVASFVLLMLCEVLGFLEFFQGRELEYLMRAYYVIAQFSLGLVVIYVGRISGNRIRSLPYFIYGSVLALSVLILGTDYIIMGSESTGHIHTAIQGRAYSLFQITSVGMQLLLLVLLWAGYKRPQNHFMQIQCVYTLFAIMPLFTGSLAILSLMAMGYQINAAVVMPLLITFFVVVTMVSESKHELLDVRSFIPFSAERRTSHQIMDIYSGYSRDDLSYREAISEIERLLVLAKYERAGGNASATAKLLGMPRSSLYSIFLRLGIEFKD